MSHLLVIAIVSLAAVLVAIYLLARQKQSGTEELAWKAEQLLMHLVRPTGKGEMGEPTWCGLTIRRLAHVVEYGVLGIASLMVAIAALGLAPKALALSCLICLVASVADETHKVFVPGRYFDCRDLVLDAIGYLPPILLALLASALMAPGV